jgi:hypothetical protein
MSAAQIRILGRLAAKLNDDPRHPIDVFTEFFKFTAQEQDIFLRGFYDRDDPVEVLR